MIELTEEEKDETIINESDLYKATISIETQSKDIANKQIKEDLQKMQNIVKNK